MCQLGNARVNAIYEFDIPSHVKRPTSESSRAARETFIRLKYAQHAFVHPHPNFERPEIPPPARTITELLAPSKSPLNIHRSGGSPRSPTKRSFSPSSFLRSPRLQKNFNQSSLKSSSRPSSASSATAPSDFSTPADSVEDLRQAEDSRSLALLADNLKKLEKSGKYKAWGNQKLGDKIRSTARRSSKRISSYARNKISGARDRLKPKDRAGGGREVYSDLEDEDMATTSTPLLYSMSASTNNLSSSYSSPPPKPPRTFATKRISSASLSDEDSDLFKESDDFAEILSAIKEMGVLCKSTSSLEKLDSEVALPNGVVTEEEGIASSMKKSESSPQLSHNKVSNLNEPPVNSKGTSPGLSPLNSIAEDQSSKQDLTETDGSHLTETDRSHLTETDGPSYLGASSNSIDLPSSVVEPALTDPPGNERIPNSFPLRRKKILAVSVAFDSSLSHSVLSNSEDDLSISVEACETSMNTDNSKRFSIMSTTSADFFSADSSEASDSKIPSICVTPEPFVAPKVDLLRAPSNCSVEDECFSTPPSTPTLPGSSRSTLDRDEHPTNHIEEVDHVAQTVVNGEVSNEENEKAQVTNDDTQSQLHTSNSTPTKRKRALTVSDSIGVRSLNHNQAIQSKDDNFNTEYKLASDSSSSLISSFSQQDMMDILGNEQSKTAEPVMSQALSIPEEIEEEPSEGVVVSEVAQESVICEGVSDVETIVIPDSVTPNEVCCVVL